MQLHIHTCTCDFTLFEAITRKEIWLYWIQKKKVENLLLIRLSTYPIYYLEIINNSTHSHFHLLKQNPSLTDWVISHQVDSFSLFLTLSDSPLSHSIRGAKHFNFRFVRFVFYCAVCLNHLSLPPIMSNFIYKSMWNVFFFWCVIINLYLSYTQSTEYCLY